MRPNTMPSGSLTTPRQRPVSTITFNATLVNRPKNAFQSPGTQKLGRVLAVSVADMGASSIECGEQRRRVGDPAEDAALRGDHGQRGVVKLGEIGSDAVA